MRSLVCKGVLTPNAQNEFVSPRFRWLAATLLGLAWHYIKVISLQDILEPLSNLQHAVFRRVTDSLVFLNHALNLWAMAFFQPNTAGLTQINQNGYSDDELMSATKTTKFYYFVRILYNWEIFYYRGCVFSNYLTSELTCSPARRTAFRAFVKWCLWKA